MKIAENKVLEDFVLSLFEIKAIKFGSFSLKSGVTSPFYIDLRVLVSYPKIMKTVGKLYWNIAKDLKFDLLCGVPYTALPIASCISVNQNVPMVMTRLETKTYGTKKQCEGNYTNGQKTLVIEDVLASGTSVLETINVLHNSGLQATEVVILLDRGHGGIENLSEIGVKAHSVIKLSQILEILKKYEKITEDDIDKIRTWQENFKVNLSDEALNEFNSQTVKKSKVLRLSYSKRAEFCTHEISKKLFTLMDAKKSNLCVSIDLTSVEEILRMCDLIGPYVVMVKLHVDIIEDFSYDTFVPKLSQLADMHKFLIFEDRKFADIGTTVSKQYKGGIYKISNWAHIINAHVFPGETIMNGLKKGSNDTNKSGCLLIAEMSSTGSFIDKKYVSSAKTMAEKHQDFIIGFISQSRVSSNPQFIHLTPGVHISSIDDGEGQQYISPEEAIITKEADIIIVGRGIIGSSDPVSYAKQYQTRAYITHTTLVNQ